MSSVAAPSVRCSTPAAVPSFVQEALRIRVFESKLLDLFQRGLLFGTIHTCIGQELCAAALHPHLRPGVDAFFATHRGHGHYLAHGGPADALLAELMGREGALCLGRGGTQNLCYKRFFSAGIQGSSAPIATGFAWALKRRDEQAITVAQLGDGTLGEGAVYEAFTFAALLQAPVLFLLEWNGWAQSTDVRTTTPGDILERAAGFGLDVDRTTDADPAALHAHLGRVVAHVRKGRPFLQVIETRRLMAHSKGDDNRPKELVEALWEDDPLSRLLAKVDTLRASAAAAQRAVDEMAAGVAERPPLVDDIGSALPTSPALCVADLHSDGQATKPSARIADELNKALHDIMEANADVILLGEDIVDPYGGAFKVTRGLSTRFPDRVLSTPIAEAGIVGVSNGLALAGMRPVAEIMFADFVTLAADQLINFAAKFHYMYAGKVACPLTVRLVSGGGRGYGPTHSQSLERLFCGIPGLRVLALSERHDPAKLLRRAVLEDGGPKIFVENKLLYAQRPARLPPAGLELASLAAEATGYPALRYVPTQGVKPDVTVVTYGGMTGPAELAMRKLLEEQELAFDYFVLTQLWPLDVARLVASVRQTRRLVVVEENVPDYGVGSAVIAAVAQRLTEPFACRAVGAAGVPLPSARHLEEKVLPSAATIERAIGELT